MNELLDPSDLTAAIKRYTIFIGEGGWQWELCCDRDWLAKLNTHPQWSFVPCESIRCYVPTPGNRVWIQNYAVIVFRNSDGVIESLPEQVTPLAFAKATDFAFTDWENDGGIKPDYEALIPLWEVEFAGRVRICAPRGAIPLRPKGPLAL